LQPALKSTQKKIDDGSFNFLATIYVPHGDLAPTSVTCSFLWHGHDIEKAKRSIRRHNKTCLILDKRDQIVN
jgi:hypothetical protein